MNYEFLTEARDEFWEAALYYESKEAGLGLRCDCLFDVILCLKRT
jgi:hypothetical protein